MPDNQKINPEFIIQIKDKEFIVFKGILDKAHQEGLCLIDTEIKQFPDADNNYTAVVKAVVKTEKGTFSGTGDANPENVNYMIVPHIIRMAETRAVARALRFACNIGVTAFEELGDIEDNNKNPDKSQKSNKRKEINSQIIEQQKKAITNLLKETGVDENQIESSIKERFGTAFDELSFEQAASIIKKLSHEVNGKRRKENEQAQGNQ